MIQAWLDFENRVFFDIVLKELATQADELELITTKIVYINNDTILKYTAYNQQKDGKDNLVIHLATTVKSVKDINLMLKTCFPDLTLKQLLEITNKILVSYPDILKFTKRSDQTLNIVELPEPLKHLPTFDLNGLISLLPEVETYALFANS
jgi:hypothetical protein